MKAMTVSLLDAGEEQAWDAFVREQRSATFFHLSGWKSVIERAFGHRTFYLVARRRGEICGVLPLTQVRSLLFGNSLISNAFCIHGGILAEDEDARDRLRTAAIEIGRERNVGWIEFRSADDAQAPWRSRSDLYVTFRRPLTTNVEENLKAIPRKHRAKVRKAIAHGLRSEVDEDVERLHRIYAHSVRRLGTPVFSKKYFQLLKEVFGTACDVVTVLDKTRPIASMMSFYFRDEVMTYYGGGLKEAREVAGNDFMYWEVMRRACERGVGIFDFGRSKIGTGAHDFKREWGFKPIPLSYEFLLLNSPEIPDVNPLSPKYRMAIDLWRRLPLAVTNLVGPHIVRSIG
jgi:FemAB-related protein (PEP-CTERM system-associated)